MRILYEHIMDLYALFINENFLVLSISTKTQCEKVTVKVAILMRTSITLW